MKKIKSAILTVAVALMAMLGVGACSEQSEPGEVNVANDEFYEDEGSMIVPDKGDDEDRYSDTAMTGEQYYEDSDHENHENNNSKELGDGAYDGPGDGIERDEVQE